MGDLISLAKKYIRWNAGPGVYTAGIIHDELNKKPESEKVTRETPAMTSAEAKSPPSFAKETAQSNNPIILEVNKPVVVDQAENEPPEVELHGKDRADQVFRMIEGSEKDKAERLKQMLYDRKSGMDGEIGNPQTQK